MLLLVAMISWHGRNYLEVTAMISVVDLKIFEITSVPSEHGIHNFNTLLPTIFLNVYWRQ
jgi:hypothetical protein